MMGGCAIVAAHVPDRLRQWHPSLMILLS